MIRHTRRAGMWSALLAGAGLATWVGLIAVPPAMANVPNRSHARPSSGVEGQVLFSPVCPVEHYPPDPACAPRPGPADIRLLRSGRVVATARAGSDGRFRIVVPPGRYEVGASPGPIGIPTPCTANPSPVRVVPFAFAQVDVHCDTGIQ
ncbi:MAG TPA: hypothetical protein VM121_11685 [Acidimicrobiales bacterium]|nr:hypothetical protein [Acidimicrobiales bacterium]